MSLARVGLFFRIWDKMFLEQEVVLIGVRWSYMKFWPIKNQYAFGVYPTKESVQYAFCVISLWCCSECEAQVMALEESIQLALEDLGCADNEE